MIVKENLVINLELKIQKLNKDKTSIFFSRNTSLEKREEISRFSGLQATQSYDKYLGLPTLVGK
jgi:hypothetical protein